MTSGYVRGAYRTRHPLLLHILPSSRANILLLGGDESLSLDPDRERARSTTHIFSLGNMRRGLKEVWWSKNNRAVIGGTGVASKYFRIATNGLSLRFACSRKVGSQPIPLACLPAKDPWPLDHFFINDSDQLWGAPPSTYRASFHSMKGLAWTHVTSS